MDNIFKINEDEYWYNAHLTEKMNHKECINYLSNEAKRMIEKNEIEIAYEIYREIIRRESNPDKEIWLNLSQCAKQMGKIEEYAEAIRRFNL